MREAKQLLDAQFFEMRWRVLSLAADLDRLERQKGYDSLADDPRLRALRQAVQALLDDGATRAQRVQMIFSDTTPASR
jgi:hypothetical protein